MLKINRSRKLPPGKADKSPKNGCLKRLLIGLTALIVLGVVLELGTRVTVSVASWQRSRREADEPQVTTSLLYQPDDDLGWVYRPGAVIEIPARLNNEGYTIQINEAGFYDHDYPLSKPDGDGFRVMVIGDSFAESWQVPLSERSFQQLEDRYNATSESPFEIIEFGAPRYSPNQYYRYYLLKGYQYDPDVTIVLFELSTDVDEMHPDSEKQFLWFSNEPTVLKKIYTVEDGKLALVNRENWHPPDLTSDEIGATPTETSPGTPAQGSSIISHVDIFLMKYSVFYGTTSRKLIELPAIRNMLIRAGVISRVFPLASHFQAGYEDEMISEVWPILEVLLDDFRDQVEADGGEFAVVIAPSMYSVYPDWFFSHHPDYEDFRSQYDPDKLERQLVEILNRQDITYMSLTPALRTAAQSSDENLFEPSHRHWTLAGQDVVTEALDEWFQEQGWSPDSADQ